ncbi:LAME_0E08350g1_1 [Lachancea meyersii CBS 8951]|uniref:Signal peptidase complex subunit 2 n=1 Tax=Lachancea meyersii CBS 8951 TaxID=1266667 RepID=A0A1G4JIY3_9SACH|nr:LAME_0E08350g1_1 [Lachancea meyersii CBS 8951]
MSKPINVYSTPELRQTLDEALPATFQRLGFKQSFQLIDTKLILGYSIAVVAGISFLLDKKLKYDESLTYQKLLVAAYALLSGVFWCFCKYVEKGVKYSGSSKDRTIVVKTKMEKYSVDYHVTVQDEDRSVEVILPANTVFNEAGYLQSDRLFEWFEQQLDSLAKKAE